MASKYELPISPNYVPTWGVVEAVRELFQNAIDQQTTVDDNTMFFDYEYGTESLTIGNKLSVLEPASLIMGASTKQGDDSTIGQFGEGYKIALIVLLREGKKVTFYNYGKREVWTTKFVNSRRFGSKILQVTIEKKEFWKKVPDNNFTICIEGITSSELREIKESNLYLSPPVGRIIETEEGTILLDEQYSGHVYVGGLFVCTHDRYEYGYNLPPSELELDRDRKLVSDFALTSIASRVWSSLSEEEIAELYDIINRMLVEDKDDIRYLASTLNFMRKGSDSPFARLASKQFYTAHGTNAVPLKSSRDSVLLPPGKRGVVVSEGLYNVITNSDTVDMFSDSSYYHNNGPENLYDELLKWYRDNRTYLPSSLANELADMLGKYKIEDEGDNQ